MKAYQTPLDKVKEVISYYGDRTHMPQILMRSERNVYAWQHMSELMATQQIIRDGPISELPEKLDPSIGKVLVKYADGTSRTVKDVYANNTMDAILVFQHGNVLFEDYKTMRPFDKHNWMSCGKTIAATLVCLLWQEGKVDLKKPVSTYLPELKGSVWDDVTVEACADMATGLDSTEHDEQPVDDGRTNPEKGFFKWAASIDIFPNVDGSTATPFEVMRNMKRTKPAHTAFEYCSINTYALERIVNAVTGQEIGEAFGERAWRKMGAQNDGYIWLNKYGQAASFGMTSSVLRDMGRWGMLFTPSWNKISAEKVIPDALIKTIQKDGKPEIYTKGRLGQHLQALFPNIPGISNRLQWDAVFPDGDFWKAGTGGQGLYVSPSRDAVIVWFSTGTEQDEHAALVLGRAIAENLGK